MRRLALVVPTVRIVAALCVAIGLANCAADGPRTADRPSERGTTRAEGPATVRIDAAQGRRLQRVMAPLIARMNEPLAAKDVSVTVWDDTHINAANAGGGAFYVTTGLLARANDDQLRGIMAHEIAHADLGHVAKTQTLATGLGIGTLILDQILPGSGAITPIAGRLLLSAHTRSEEADADAHAVRLLQRSGYDGRTVMAGALVWIQRTEGDSGGGFFDTHPATGDRISAIESLP